MKKSSAGIGLEVTSFALHIMAMLFMLCDHLWGTVVPGNDWLTCIGRLAFPIFAYMIAEGCTYTRNRKRYLGTLAAMAALFQLVYFVAMDSVYQGIFVTFTLSVSMIFAIDRALSSKTPPAILAAVGVTAAVVFLTVILPELLPHTDYDVDYGLWGVLLPVVVYLVPGRAWKLLATALMLIPLACMWGGNQWFAFAALIPLALYSGQRGKYKMKNLFYIYYPAHLVVIWLLDLLL
jgi:hypothetical protein